MATARSAKGLGDRGEAVAEAWLRQQGWETVARQWRCSWGELDLVMYRDPVLSFVEVKTRRPHSWDQQGALAITAGKQRRLLLTAQVFLTTFPQWAEAACRFDVALVETPSWQVHDYLEAAFELR